MQDIDFSDLVPASSGGDVDRPFAHADLPGQDGASGLIVDRLNRKAMTPAWVGTSADALSHDRQSPDFGSQLPDIDFSDLIPRPPPATPSTKAAPTGSFTLDDILATPHVKEAIENPRINRQNDVPYGAGADDEGPVTNIDRHVPSAETINGLTFDPAEPANVHEQVEREVMRRLIAAAEQEKGHALTDDEVHAIYLKAHREFATPAEKQWVETRLGPGSWPHYQHRWNGWLAHIEHEKPERPPPNLYLKPYPHREAEFLAREQAAAAAALKGP